MPLGFQIEPAIVHLFCDFLIMRSSSSQVTLILHAVIHITNPGDILDVLTESILFKLE